MTSHSPDLHNPNISLLSKFKATKKIINKSLAQFVNVQRSEKKE